MGRKNRMGGEAEDLFQVEGRKGGSRNFFLEGKFGKGATLDQLGEGRREIWHLITSLYMRYVTRECRVRQAS